MTGPNADIDTALADLIGTGKVKVVKQGSSNRHYPVSDDRAVADENDSSID